MITSGRRPKIRRVRNSRKVKAAAPRVLQSFTVSGNVGGSKRLTLNASARDVQNVVIALPRGQELSLNAIRFFLHDSNLRLEIRISDQRNPDDPSFPPRFFRFPSHAGEFGSRSLLRNDVTDLALVRLKVAVVARKRAIVDPSDGWALKLSIKKLK